MKKSINKGIAFLATLLTVVILACSPIGPGLQIENNPSAAPKAVTIGGTYSATLYAGQHINAGTVDLSINGENLVVTYNTVDGWELNEVHLFVGENLADMPQAKNGNPKIGNFPYTESNVNGATSYEFVIPLSDFGGEPYICGKTYYVAAHAALQKDNGDGTYQTETGWGDGERLTQRGSWATYFSFVFNCGPDDPEPEPKDCETAFAYGDTTFIDLGLTDSRWGWVLDLSNPVSGSAPIYAGAGQNDITKGVHVGDLLYSYDGAELTVTFSMYQGYVMEETHLYASALVPDTIAPGQYGNIHDLTNASSDTYVIPVSGNPVYVIAHAVVCSAQ